MGNHIRQSQFSLRERKLCLAEETVVHTQKQVTKDLNKSTGDQKKPGQTEFVRRSRWTDRCCLKQKSLLTTANKILTGFIVETCRALAAVHDSRVQETNLLSL